MATKSHKTGFLHTKGTFEVVHEKSNGDVIASYSSEFKGKEYFNLRTCWRDDKGLLQPGKGLCVFLSEKDDLINALIAHYSKPKLKAVS